MKPEAGPTSANPAKYRPDIDGLRALAILPVILYHARLGCPGGFVGVDVFFVISGFLIASLILQELADGSFSLLHFWERRIRRILPALTVVVLATLIAGYFLLLPEDFAFVGRSAGAVSVLGANFFFLKQSGYFAPGAETEPLLHTWSLAVEEQFYLLFPLLLIFLARFRKISVLTAIVWLGLMSLTLSIAGTHSRHNLSATFFLLPTRAWELMMGAGLAALCGRISAEGTVREVCGWLGLALIVWPVFCYSTATRFPGLAALPPCLGAALVIFSSEAKLSSAGRLLALRPVVFTGLVSYSLYLWHWPLLAFAAYMSDQQPVTAVQTGLLVAAFGLAILSWQFIEKPFRQRRVFRQRPQIFSFAGASLLLLLGLGLLADIYKGFPDRFPAKVMAYANVSTHNPYLDYDKKKPWVGHLARFSTTQTNRPVDVVIWGDSHALVLTPVIDTLCQRQSWRDMDATHPGTPPVAGPARIKESSNEVPADFSMAVMKYIAESRPRAAVLAARWSLYTASEPFKTVRGLLALGVRVYVVKDVPFPNYNVPHFAALAVLHGDDINRLGVTPERHRQANQELEATFDQIAQLGATVLDPAPLFLNQDGRYRVEKDGAILYHDGEHLSEEGSMMLAPLFEPVFRAE
jgi:peptidoglycan/LPS O-acetylase OafA/YrhL